MALSSQKSILSGLTEAQREVVTDPGGPMLVIAGAGSGKTRTLTHRLAYLIASGTRPSEIVALTFTNKAAGEMKTRITKILGSEMWENQLFVGTFHGFSAKLLREHGTHIGLPASFTILDEDESETLMKHALKNLNIPRETIDAHSALGIISKMKSECAKPKDLDERIAPKHLVSELKAAWDEYENLLFKSHYVDFDNLLLLTLELFEKSPETLRKIQTKIGHILVDEYQDTNRPQYLITKYLAELHKNIFVVGDDWQSIYAFRGSDYRNILNFEKDWPGAKVFFLEENFRSTKIIVEAANHVIAKNQYRTEKKLFTKNPHGVPIYMVRTGNEISEAEYVVETIKNLTNRGRPLSDFCVMFRTHAQSRPFEEELIEKQISYRLVGGFKFYKRREVQDLIAYLRYIVNPEDHISFARIINVPPRGIGEVTRRRISKSANLAGLTHEGAAKFFRTIKIARSKAEKDTPSKLLKWLIEEIGYETHLKPISSDANKMRWENVGELISVMTAFDLDTPPLGLQKFLATISMLGAEDEYSQDYERVTLMTIHAAKGLEFPLVFVAGCEEGIFPHSSALFDEQKLEEERRLMYVALTRAKEETRFTYAKRRIRFGSFESNSPSRFLYEIPKELIMFVDQTMSGNDHHDHDEAIVKLF